MITAFFKDGETFRFVREVQTVEGLKDAVWIDVLRPTPEEKTSCAVPSTSNSPCSIRPFTTKTTHSL